MSFFLMIVNIALRIKNPFYKLIALGLGTEYAFQVILTIGGATKFIPMTGVTLPLVSYGGSSVMSTILMLAIIPVSYTHLDVYKRQLQGTVNGFATAVGFTLSIIVMAGIREKIEYNDIPESFRGFPIVLITAGLMAIAFFGFSGLI